VNWNKKSVIVFIDFGLVLVHNGLYKTIKVYGVCVERTFKAVVGGSNPARLSKLWKLHYLVGLFFMLTGFEPVP